jgi:hypothetical protein
MNTIDNVTLVESEMEFTNSKLMKQIGNDIQEASKITMI